MTVAIQRLQRLCQEWGGELVITNEYDAYKNRPGWSEAQFTHSDLGIDWKAKLIAAEPGIHPGEVIHEMGHVFACLKPPSNEFLPGKGKCTDKEEQVFHGWEWCLAHYIRLPIKIWREVQMHYGVGDLDEFQDLTPAQQLTYLRKWRKVGLETDILKQEGSAYIPLAIR